ncbi:MAG: thioredoxin domain-containing protein [archaeon]
MSEDEHKEHTEHKPEHKIELPKRRRRNNFWMIAAGVLFALLIISMFTRGFTSLTGGGVGAPIGGQQAGERAIKYVNDVILQGQTTATIGDVKDVGDLYNVKLTIGAQQFDSYITKDARLFFPQGIDLNEEVPTQEEVQAQTCEDMPKLDKPTVEVYYMAYCPYGVQAMIGMYPVAKLMGDKVDIVPHFVIYDNYQGGGVDYCINDGTLCSMHGINELNEDIRQACIYKYQKDKFWDYVNCAMTDCSLSNIKTCWETCADKTGVDKTKVNECFTNEGAALMEAEKKLNEENSVEGSPTIFVNGEPYEGGRAPDQFKEGICCGFKTEPSECSQTLSTTGAATAGSC